MQISINFALTFLAPSSAPSSTTIIDLADVLKVGTPEYMSPEVAEALATHTLQPYDELCDVWSLGVIL